MAESYFGPLWGTSCWVMNCMAKWCKNMEEECGVALVRSLNSCGLRSLGNKKQQKILIEKKGGMKCFRAMTLEE